MGCIFQALASNANMKKQRRRCNPRKGLTTNCKPRSIHSVLSFCSLSEESPYKQANMPPRKRSNWRQPTVFDHPGGGGRRTTRAARQSAGQSHKSSSQYATRDGVTVNVSRSKERVQGWIEVWRPPAPGVGFAVPIWVQIDKLTPEERDEYLPSADAKSEEGGEAQDQAETTAEKSNDDADPMQSGTEPMQIDTPEKTNVPTESYQQPATTVTTTTPATSGETTLADGPKSESGVTPSDENNAPKETLATPTEAPNEKPVETSTTVAENNPKDDVTTEAPAATTAAIDDAPAKPIVGEEVTKTAPEDSPQPVERNDPKGSAVAVKIVMGGATEGEAPPKASATGESPVVKETITADLQAGQDPKGIAPAIATTEKTEQQTEATPHAPLESSGVAAQTGDNTAEEPETKRQRVEGPDTTSTS
eukprot:scaffold337_cov172-Amphora_coffeaeformis.AAC.5